VRGDAQTRLTRLSTSAPIGAIPTLTVTEVPSGAPTAGSRSLKKPTMPRVPLTTPMVSITAAAIFECLLMTEI
jgi:hypothetical protein